MEGSLLDLGCGYGVIAIITKTIFPQLTVTAVDINPRAAELAMLNGSNNNVDIDVKLSDGFSQIETNFDIILTNPPIRTGKKVIYGLFADAYEHLTPGGYLYIVIRRKQGAESAMKEIERLFGMCNIILREKGFWVLEAKKAGN